MDRRQLKTRKAVFEAFKRLLGRKAYSSITVQRIIDEADIGRSTFYAHFETKDDLLKAFCTEIFEHVFSKKLMKEETHDFSSDKTGINGKVTHILYHLHESRQYLQGILSCESGEVFMKCFKEHLATVFSHVLDGSAPGVPESYMLNHLVSGFAETVRWWFNNDRYTPEQVGQFYCAVNPCFR